MPGPRLPAVAVCIPTTGRPSLVERALPSVLGQADGLDLEVVVALNGNGSAPRPDLPDDPRLRVLDAVPGRVGAVRNAAAATTDADVLVFLDDDDELAPGGLATLVAPLAAPVVELVSGVARRLQPDGSILLRRPRDLGPLFAGLVGTYMAGSFAVRHALFDSVGGYDERLDFGENTELFMRLGQALDGDRVRAVDLDDVVVHLWPSGERYLAERAATGPLILERHAAVFARQPAARAQWEALTGVAAFRAGQRSKGRRHLARAVRARPAEPAHWLRLGLSLLPPLARRRWSRGTDTASLG